MPKIYNIGPSSYSLPSVQAESDFLVHQRTVDNVEQYNPRRVPVTASTAGFLRCTDRGKAIDALWLFELFG